MFVLPKFTLHCFVLKHVLEKICFEPSRDIKAIFHTVKALSFPEHIGKRIKPYCAKIEKPKFNALKKEKTNIQKLLSARKTNKYMQKKF